MKMKFLSVAIALGAAVTSLPAAAQTMDHSAHAGHIMAQEGDAVEGMEADAKAVLVAYREAISARDADAMTALFTEGSSVFENGKDEGTFAYYMEHHLGPELDAITSFTFGDPTMAITRMGHIAYGRETYTYRIELSDGRVIEREGVATSVLHHDAEGWKIVQYHSSSRTPRG
ncbi:MAG: nuclear transport factor 2 family protein [Pontixanthobacter sp.]